MIKRRVACKKGAESEKYSCRGRKWYEGNVEKGVREQGEASQSDKCDSDISEGDLIDSERAPLCFAGSSRLPLGRAVTTSAPS